ncbi:MAG: phosphate--AMP phosphotransferase [Lachnospiraceae bacterium]|nr:phosphate--AMP phosphotransferase [Lachnospiraceae bacterium]
MLKEFVRPEDGLSKEERKEAVKKYKKDFTALLNPLKESKIPVIVLVEGWASSGKGYLINELISEIDPRFFSVFSLDTAQDSHRYPFIYPYYCAIPENGKMLFMDSGWLSQTVEDCVNGRLAAAEREKRLRSINNFERQMKNNGCVVLKLFINCSKKKQKKTQENLLSDKNTRWRISEKDLAQNDRYGEYQKEYDYWMNATSITPWHILDSDSKGTVIYDAFKLLYDTIKASIENGKFDAPPYEEAFTLSDPLPSLDKCDTGAFLDDETYKKELKKLQKDISELHNIIYRKKIPFVICYEGWDAAGKGGNIRRLAKPLDPRGFDTYPIASPEPHEKARHHLWRFWTKIPRTGHVAIFDRTWYGRVMVERIEGFCSENEWRRAYNEINEFEKELSDWGAVVIKFWIQIDKDTQLQRFTERQNTPEKQWKITDEDWRNREKWDKYEEAVNDMLKRTSTAFAPWHIIESYDKKYARIKALRIVRDAMKKAVSEDSNE